MSTRLVAFFLIGALSFAPAAVALEGSVDADLEEGIRQAQLGDFEKAVITLDGVSRRLAAEGGRSSDLARAYVYLSISYLGLSQEQKAKAQFLEALKADTEMELDEGEFPPRILEFFEAAREEATAQGVAEPAAPSAGPPAAEPEPVAEASTPAPEPEKKGGSKTLLLIGGGAAAAAGIALAVGGGGGDSGSSAPTTPSPPAQQMIEVMSPDVPKPILDLSSAVSQLNVSATGTIVGDGTLEFRIVHTCRNDLELALRHPDGTVWTARGPEDCGDLWEGPLPFPGGGKASNGVWTLTARDVAEGDAGVLEVWGLRLTVQR